MAYYYFLFMYHSEKDKSKRQKVRKTQRLPGDKCGQRVGYNGPQRNLGERGDVEIFYFLVWW